MNTNEIKLVSKLVSKKKKKKKKNNIKIAYRN